MMSGRPIIDLTPEADDHGYQQHGQSVLRAALANLEREVPDIVRELDADRAAFLSGQYLWPRRSRPRWRVV